MKSSMLIICAVFVIILGKAKEQGFPGIIYTDPFHPGMFVHVRQPALGDVREFSRSEDFATGEITVQWTDDRGRWSRRTFVSRADNVIAACFTGAGKVNCQLLFPSLNPTVAQDGGGWVAGVSAEQIKSRRTSGVGSVTYHNVYTKGKGGFDAAIRVCLGGGKATVGNDGITIQDADEVLLLMRIVPWKTPLPKDRSEAWAYTSENPDFAEKNLGRYVACPKLADSSVVAFANTDAAETLMPKLKASLERLSADYDVLFERHVALHRPLFERARLDLGALPQQRAISSEQLLDEANRSEKMSLALAEKIYDAGRYMFLCATRTIPFLEAVAAFYEDFVVIDETTGKIKFIPSYSPETGACTSATMDVMVMRDVLSNLIAAYRALNIKTRDIPKWQALLARLPDYRTNEDGALAEWIPEGRQERYGHRHLSHLHSAYEANGELGPDADLDLRAAAQEAVRRRIHSGGEPSSHGRAHMGLAAAELGLAQEAYGRIEIMATGRSMAPSLMCTHEPAARIYNVDANGALPEIMHRMLFRARLGSIELLPALPDAWPKGQISGVLAKGRITIVRLAWDAPARSVTCVLRSQIDQTVTVELPAYDSKGALTRSITLKTKENTPVTLTWQRSAQ
jgi:hypothetical protein